MCRGVRIIIEYYKQKLLEFLTICYYENAGENAGRNRYYNKKLDSNPYSSQLQ